MNVLLIWNGVYGLPDCVLLSLNEGDPDLELLRKAHGNYWSGHNESLDCIAAFLTSPSGFTMDSITNPIGWLEKYGKQIGKWCPFILDQHFFPPIGPVDLVFICGIRCWNGLISLEK